MGQQAVLITGAGSGLGRMIALRFGARGLAVALVGRRESLLGETASLLDKTCPGSLILPADVREPDQVREVMRRIRAEWGGLNAVVNNAALLAHSSEQSVDPWTYFDCVVRTNIKGPALVAEMAVELMAPGGVIINVSSSVATRPTPNAMAYGASKAALDHLTASQAVRYAPRRIRAVSVAPGGLFNNDGQKPTSEDATADLVLYLASRHGARVNGTVLRVDDGESVRTFVGRMRPKSGPVDGESR
jgi:3-oxoacyl-[acyl-carrier protein] reductase